VRQAVIQACFKKGAFVTDFKSEINRILEKHKGGFALEPLRFPDDELENDRLERKREFHLMSAYLTAALDEEDVEELKQRIADKLAYNSLQRIGENDWWWSPADDLIASTLRDVLRTLEKDTKKTTGDKLRKFRWIWWVLSELIYLAVIIGLFSAASSKFETVVIAALVLIYSKIALVGSGIAIFFVYLAHTAELIYWEFGRTLRLKVPVSRLTEAKKALGDLPVPSFIRNVSIGIGSLIAVWHLVVVLLA
jgi:hypothetical protein